MYEIPLGEEWRLGLLRSLLELRQSNWEVLFDEEGENTLEEDDISEMIDEVCTS